MKRSRQILSLSISHFFVDFYMNMVPSLLFILGQQRGLSLAQQSSLMLVMSMTSSTLQPLLGLWSDHRGKGWHLMVTGTLIALGMTAVAWIPTLPLMMVAVAMAGAANALYHPLGSVVTTHVAQYNKASVLSTYITAGSLGYALTPVIVVPLALNWGLDKVGFLAAVGVFTSLLLATTGIHGINLRNRDNLPKRADGHLQQAPMAAKTRIAWQQLPWFPVILLNLIVSLRSWVHLSFTTLGIQLMVERGFTGEVAGLGMTWFLVAGTIGTMLSGRWADRWGAPRVFAGSLFLSAIAIGLTVISHGNFLWLAIGLLGAALSASFPLTIMMAQELMPKYAGLASGMMQGLGFGIGSLGLVLTGHLAENYNLDFALSWMIGPAVMAFGLSFMYNTQHSKVQERQSLSN